MKWSVEVASLSKVDASYEGYNVYLCKTLAKDGFKSEADIANYLYGTGNNSGATVKTGSRSPYSYKANNTAVGISDDDQGMQTVYAVIVSKDGKGYWTVEGSGEVYTTATSPVTAAIDAKTAITGAYTAWAGADPTPEPTSGLLLLLGVAGLALRRKQ